MMAVEAIWLPTAGDGRASDLLYGYAIVHLVGHGFTQQQPVDRLRSLLAPEQGRAVLQDILKDVEIDLTLHERGWVNDFEGYTSVREWANSATSDDDGVVSGITTNKIYVISHLVPARDLTAQNDPDQALAQQLTWQICNASSPRWTRDDEPAPSTDREMPRTLWHHTTFIRVEQYGACFVGTRALKRKTGSADSVNQSHVEVQNWVHRFMPDLVMLGYRQLDYLAQQDRRSIGGALTKGNLSQALSHEWANVEILGRLWFDTLPHNPTATALMRRVQRALNINALAEETQRRDAQVRELLLVDSEVRASTEAEHLNRLVVAFGVGGLVLAGAALAAEPAGALLLVSVCVAVVAFVAVTGALSAQRTRGAQLDRGWNRHRRLTAPSLPVTSGDSMAAEAPRHNTWCGCAETARTSGTGVTPALRPE